jgi:hypothetical protein
MAETLLATVQVAVLLSVVVVSYAAFRMVRLLARQVGIQAAAVARAVDLGQAQRQDAIRPVLAAAVHALEGHAEPTTGASGWPSRTLGPGRRSPW